MMGTISVVSKKTSSEVVSRFRNSIDEPNPNLTKREQRNIGLEPKEKRNYKENYSSYLYGYFADFFLFLAYNPRPFFNPLPQFKLTFHLSQFENLKHLATTLVEIFDWEIAREIFFNWTIIRQDCWLDLEMPYTEAKNSIYKKHIICREEFAHNARTYYMGSRRSNKHHLIYEKPPIKVPRERLDLKFKKPRNLEYYTRHEARFKGKECLIKHLCDFPKMADKKPFKGIYANHFLCKEILKKSDLTERQRKILVPFFKDLKFHGLQYARTQANKDKRNFYRTIQPILEQYGRDLDFNGRWKRKVEMQILNGFDIEDFFSNESGNSQVEINPNRGYKDA